MKVQPFDSESLSDVPIEGMCEFTAMEIGEDFSLTYKPIACGESGAIKHLFLENNVNPLSL